VLFIISYWSGLWGREKVSINITLVKKMDKKPGGSFFERFESMMFR